jgi:hypothetical protein
MCQCFCCEAVSSWTNVILSNLCNFKAYVDTTVYDGEKKYFAITKEDYVLETSVPDPEEL